MLLRFLAAILGGVLITAVMLIGMSEFAALFRQRSSDRIFLIDILPAPERGRRDRPDAPTVSPQREVENPRGEDAPIDVRVTADPEVRIEAEAVAPALEAPPASQ